jgi:iron uptake system component EfeO
MSAPERDVLRSPPGRLMYVAAVGAAVLAVAAGLVFYYASQRNAGHGRKADSIQVSVSAKSCDPNNITVPGGKRSFEILNNSDRTIEWEILDGVMVIAERENIAPGFKQTLTANLTPGTYQITCGLLSNPRGVLHVTDSEEARAAAKVSLRTFLGPLSEYKVYLVQQAAAAVQTTQDLDAAIKSGDLDRARSAWKQARLHYKRIEPVAFRISDLENTIDPIADYLEKREDDAAFKGFHRIEYGLYSKNSTEGLAPVAGQLVADMTALRSRLGTLKLTPLLLLAIPTDMADQLAQGKVVNGEDHYAHNDLADIDANLEGIEKVAGLLQTIVKPVDANLEAEIDQRLKALRIELDRLRISNGFPSYDNIDKATRTTLSDNFAKLARTLAKLNSVIGVN